MFVDGIDRLLCSEDSDNVEDSRDRLFETSEVVSSLRVWYLVPFDAEAGRGLRTQERGLQNGSGK